MFFGWGGGVVVVVVVVEEPQPLAIPTAPIASNRKLRCATEVRFAFINILP
jgi:hypothetical protein